ncbi:precorrin-6y C5,15-methyltransferase (decarboxylating) subunit CbiE [Thermocoleostomius sinensis]|jgi:precorrin-6Y C5,15-methyltransferase (decarboxylating)|uniref:tRNA (guanine(46)-N(7))-methyltransferase n=1 Tax=Thermocoleostomius sinensis A174 TaxID=2016057 RepID=A0A9E8ZCW1_9CYAN|nr:precorrin-6y C5,15-methyltransferase (decarboxylating) subunit CbiE [Thermocoleostomius sinensis]WAL59078.1 precorrin-6y C5,15-methyltransferase (decarboxylating) subunit CbiE [Thermocoleostomius sinensis A174]
MTPIHVVGIGLDGVDGLSAPVKHLLQQATFLIGSDRHLSYLSDYAGERWVLGDFRQAIQHIKEQLQISNDCPEQPPLMVILTSGDPLFFGLGRLLLAELPAEQLTFHPHLSSVQLAFSRVKVAWQDAQIISAHGRSLDELSRVLQQGAEKIAILTDKTNTPQAIARLLFALNLPWAYQLWVCENLGGNDEQVRCFRPEAVVDESFAPLNVVILLRDASALAATLDSLPALGIADHQFLSFPDRPGLMTKREVRLLVLGELKLQPHQTIWDIGAGTGSVSIEMARLFPSSQIYAVEQTAIGISLIQQNSQRFNVQNITSVHGSAPTVLEDLPQPDRIFIGGSSGKLHEILHQCSQRLHISGTIVVALATLEHLTVALNWLQTAPAWEAQWLQVQLSRSIPIATLTRFQPLNPVTLLTIRRRP